MKKVANSVINRSTQINKLCQAPVVHSTTQSVAMSILNANKSNLGCYYYLFLVLQISGCRISEALAIQISDISEKGNVLIKGKKGSKDRVCYIPQILEYLPIRLAKRDLIFYSMNRFTAYRLLKNLGIGKVKKGRTNASVTHIFRDEYVKDVRTTKASNRATSDSIGHKSLNSTEYYGKD